ncbi:MAG: ATP-binding protein [Bacteroidota bacterium]
MSILDSIVKTKPKAPRITIYGKHGVGKSSLAAQFPSPLFIQTEVIGLDDLKALPLVLSFKELWEKINALLALEKMPFKTIVIDSISKLDTLIIDHILDEEPPQKNGKKATLNSACGGYGAGTLRAQGLHQAFKAKMDKFQDLGITVIYISHVAITKIKSPDSEDYDIFSIVMNNDKSREPYIHDTDAVLFCKFQAFVDQTDSGRSVIKSTGDRIIMTGGTEANVSKNRFNMPPEIKMTFDSIAQYIPFFNKEIK